LALSTETTKKKVKNTFFASKSNPKFIYTEKKDNFGEQNVKLGNFDSEMANLSPLTGQKNSEPTD